jgi:hypothetical protein
VAWSKIRFVLLPLWFLAALLSASAQIMPAQPDPLAKIREAAKGNSQACSATGETLCEQVAPKIIANAMGESPLAENLRRRNSTKQAVPWGVAAFRDEGVDVHTEKYSTRIGGKPDRENVVAEIKGREKPDEWVLLGAHLDGSSNAATVIEAARDILRTGVRPRRSIRFVLFTSKEPSVRASWEYTQTHRAELDRARAVIILGSSDGRISGFMLNGRRDIEAGVREAMKPIPSWGVDHYSYEAVMGSDSFVFLLQGIPSLMASQEAVSKPGKSNMEDLTRNAAVVAVTVFGIAERAEPVGPRQSRAEIESLLKATGLDKQMKQKGAWSQWESGKRGR